MCPSLLDHEVIEALKCFHPLESRILISEDRGDGNGVKKYLGKRKDVHSYKCILCMGAF